MINATYRLILFFLLSGILLTAKAQEIVIEGKVIDAEDGSPLPFANIVLEGKPLGTITDSDGFFRFRIFNPGNDATILISYVGYDRLHVKVKDAVSTGVFKLENTGNYLDEVEVIARKEKINPSRIFRRAVNQYNSSRRKSPHIAIGYYREYAMLDERFIMFSESIGYSIFMGKMFNAALYSNYKFICQNTRALVDSKEWLSYAKDMSYKKIPPGAGSNVNVLRYSEEQGFLSPGRSGGYEIKLDSVYMMSDQLVYILFFKGRGEEGFMEVFAEDLRLLKAIIRTPGYFSRALNKRVEAEVCFQWSYFDGNPYISSIEASRTEENGYAYQNTLKILTQKFDEFKIDKDTYWYGIDELDHNPFVIYDPEDWNNFNIPEFNKIDQVRKDLLGPGADLEIYFSEKSGQWWNPADPQDWGKKRVNALIENFK